MCQALGWALGLCRPTGPCDHSASLEERTHTHTHTHKDALETTEQGTEEAPKNSRRQYAHGLRVGTWQAIHQGQRIGMLGSPGHLGEETG